MTAMTLKNHAEIKLYDFDVIGDVFRFSALAQPHSSPVYPLMMVPGRVGKVHITLFMMTVSYETRAGKTNPQPVVALGQVDGMVML
jgi:hypothetical protein